MRATDRPFCVNLVLDFEQDERLEVAIEERVPWVSFSAPHRVLRNSTYERWEAGGCPPSGRRPGEGEEVAPGIARYAVNMPLAGVEGDVEAMAMYAGQGVGTIEAVEPAAAIVERYAAALRSE
jgi:NAD(P)H-dependent flavin oxidoreductase YrpB (nitropropane dioxygenase family)